MDNSTTCFRLHQWSVDPALDAIASTEACVRLDPRPMQVLLLLAQHAGEVLSQRQIEGAVWGDVLVTSNSVYQCITQLRKALGDDPRQPQYIQTIPRKGYRLIAPVEWQHGAGAAAVERDAAPASELFAAQPLTHSLAVPLPLVATPLAPRSRWWRVSIAVGVVLATGIALETLWIATERSQAQRERERAEQVSQLMVEVFSAADPFVNLGRPITARELLKQGAQRLKTDLEQRPWLRAQVLETIGRSYRRQGLHELAVPALEEALQIRRSNGGDRQPETGSLRAELGVAFHSLGRFADSDSAFATALAIRSETAARSSEPYARLVGDIGTLELARSHPQQAAQLLNESLQILRRLSDVDPQQLATVLEGLGQAYLWLDDIERAEQAAREAFTIHERTLPALHPDRVMTTYEFAEILRLRGRMAQAEPLLQLSLTAQQRLYDAKGSQVANTLDSLAALLFAQGRRQPAARLARAAVLARQPDAAQPDAGDEQVELARQLLANADFAAAESVARAALDAYRAQQPLDLRRLAAAEQSLGEALLKQNRLEAAEKTLRDAMVRWQQLDALGWRSAHCTSTLGEVLYRQGRIAAAETLLLASYRAVAVDLAAEQPIKRRIYQQLARFYQQTGRARELQQLETRSASANMSSKER